MEKKWARAFLITHPPGGAAKVEHPYIGAGSGSRESWGGTTCNPYDTERATSGSSVSVATNLSMCSICDTTGGSCCGPATYQNVALIVPTKGMISFGGGNFIFALTVNAPVASQYR